MIRQVEGGGQECRGSSIKSVREFGHALARVKFARLGGAGISNSILPRS
jgi:hypothetical protein